MTKYANFEMGVHQNPERGHFHHFTVPLRKVVEHYLDTPTDSDFSSFIPPTNIRCLRNQKRKEEIEVGGQEKRQLLCWIVSFKKWPLMDIHLSISFKIFHFL